MITDNLLFVINAPLCLRPYGIIKETCQLKGVNPMTMYQEYTLRDGTIKSIKVIEGRSHKEEMKLLGITERDIFSMQLLDKKSPQKPK